MKTILTNKSEVIVVSDEDFPHLSQYTWHINNQGVVVRAKHSDDPDYYPAKIVSMARILFNCPARKFRVYHLDGNKLNCTRENLTMRPMIVGGNPT